MRKHIVPAAICMALALGAGASPAEAGGKVAVMASNAWAVAPGAAWAWAPTTTSADPRVANNIMDERLRAAVEASLAAKGMRQVSSPAAAEVLVSYHVRLENRAEPRVSQAYGTVCGFRGCVHGWGPASVDIQRYTEGVLVIDIVDARDGRLLWRAASEKRVTQKDATQARLDKVVADMTKSLPAA